MPQLLGQFDDLCVVDQPLEEYVKAGYARFYTHSTIPDEIKFIRDFCV